MGFRIITPSKIKKARGSRTLRDVARSSGGAFAFTALWQWENGIVRPTDENILALMRALGCRFEDISEPAELEKV